VTKMSLAHLILWMLGVAGIWVSKNSVVKQIAARERAEAVLDEERDFMASVVEAAKDAIVSADHEGKVILWNPAAEKIFGYTAGEARSQRLENLIISGPSETGFKEALSRKSTKDVELELRRKDGTRFPAEISVSPVVKTWKNPLRTIIVKDITQRRPAEDILRDAHEKLELRVQERTAELRKPMRTSMSQRNRANTWRISSARPRRWRLWEPSRAALPTILITSFKVFLALSRWCGITLPAKTHSTEGLNWH
jgi:PAS domain S-box-containing protein